MPLLLAAKLVGSEGGACCCPAVCNIIPQSLCGSADNRCSWFPEFSDSEAEPPVGVSCPPKFYKTRTDSFTYDFSCSYSDSYSYEDYSYSITVSVTGSVFVQRVRSWTWNAELQICEFSDTVTATGTVTRTVSTTETFFGSTTTFDGTQTLEPDGAYFHSGLGAYVIPMSQTSASGSQCFDGDCAPDTEGLYTNGQCTVDQVVIFLGDFSVLSPTQGEYRDTTVAPAGIVMDPPPVITAVLSDEVDLYSALAENVCPTEPCLSTDDPPEGCELCCTDRGGAVSGERYLDEPEGCIVPGTSTTAWDSSPCDTSGDRSGQAVDLAIWFKDLFPGTTYRATITYKRCSFAEDEEGNPIPPSCSGPNSCEGSPETWTTVTDEIIFTAENWAEILAINCGLCAILRKQCELEDEANAWNTANPEEEPRTVACTGGGLRVPTAAGTYTWFDSCALEEYVEP